MAIDQNYPYHSIKTDDTIEKLNSRHQGLTNEEVETRRDKYGENVLPEKGKTNIWKLIIKQFKDFLILILFVAAVISYLTSHMVDVYVIIGVILVNAGIGFFQEFKAEKSIASLKNLIKQSARVIRDGNEKTIEAKEVVPGDIILLEEGNSIPADARIIKHKNLRIIEASLTGESVPVDKVSGPIEQDTVLADRKNMVYKGTHVARGSCQAVVTATGINTEIGKIAESLQEVEEEESEFRKKTGRLAKIMAAIAVSTAAIVFLVGYFVRNFGFDDILLVTIATLVSSVPEGLPAVLSIVLAIGANRMARQNAIIREFTATETAGSLNVILSDKTGTITQSILTVKKIYLPNGHDYDVTGTGFSTNGQIQTNNKAADISENRLLRKLSVIARYCNNAALEGEDKNGQQQVSGDPTEVSLLVLSKKTEVDNTRPLNQIQVIDDLPFNSEQKFRATLIAYPDEKKEMLFVGAPEKMLELSSKVATEDGVTNLDDKKRREVKERIGHFSSESMRVIGCAWKEADNDMEQINPEDGANLVFAGLFGIIDPPRPEVKDAVALCKSAGVRVVMVTGDHKQTAAAIAGEVGIADPKDHGTDCPQALTETELEGVDEKQLSAYTDCVNVFARVNPQVKLRIARNLQAKNYLIGMTGDGVNDAPALKSADVGIAMGQKGTDVARDASQIVLSDDNFASIVNAIKEGRIVFRNVRQTSFFLITTNFASTLTLIAAIAIGFTYPLMPTQILWINLVTDGIMDIALATEPDHGDIMEQKPLKKGEPILNKQIFPYLFIIVPVMVVLALLVFDHYRGDSVEKARTGVFLVVAMTQVFNAFNMRSLNRSVFSIGFIKNKWIILAFFVSILLQFAAIKLPFLQHLFHFRDLPWTDILIITALSSLVFGFGELYKLLKNRVFN